LEKNLQSHCAILNVFLHINKPLLNISDTRGPTIFLRCSRWEKVRCTKIARNRTGGREPKRTLREVRKVGETQKGHGVFR